MKMIKFNLNFFNCVLPFKWVSLFIGEFYVQKLVDSSF